MVVPPHWQSSSTQPYGSLPEFSSQPPPPMNNSSGVTENLQQEIASSGQLTASSLWQWCDINNPTSSKPTRREHLREYHYEAFQQADKHICTLWQEFEKNPRDMRSLEAAEAIRSLDGLNSELKMRDKSELSIVGVGDIDWQIIVESWHSILNPNPQHDDPEVDRKYRRMDKAKLQTLVEKMGYPHQWASLPPY
ncbi:hypothetical protein N7540_012519 [Penicillium herquei]|nr:hypothetical protein N7540_012519 [Penicillium herquei]